MIGPAESKWRELLFFTHREVTIVRDDRRERLLATVSYKLRVEITSIDWFTCRGNDCSPKMADGEEWVQSSDVRWGKMKPISDVLLIRIVSPGDGGFIYQCTPRKFRRTRLFSLFSPPLYYTNCRRLPTPGNNGTTIIR